MLYKQTPARRALMGPEPTRNPVPAAASLLKRFSGAGRFKRALKRISRHRRSLHRGNPLPAVVGTVLGGLGGLGGRFKTPSEKRAGPAAQRLVDAAVNGNLTAAKAIAERTEIGIQKERAVWRKAFTQVPVKIVELVKKYSEQIPGVDHSTPEAAADSAIARAVNGLELEAAATAERKAAAGARGAAAARREAMAEERQARREAQLASVAGAGLQAIAGRGRRRPQRRRSRSRSRSSGGRGISF